MPTYYFLMVFSLSTSVKKYVQKLIYFNAVFQIFLRMTTNSLDLVMVLDNSVKTPFTVLISTCNSRHIQFTTTTESPRNCNKYFKILYYTATSKWPNRYLPPIKENVTSSKFHNCFGTNKQFRRRTQLTFWRHLAPAGSHGLAVLLGGPWHDSVARVARYRSLSNIFLWNILKYLKSIYIFMYISMLSPAYPPRYVCVYLAAILSLRLKAFVPSFYSILPRYVCLPFYNSFPLF